MGCFAFVTNCIFMVGCRAKQYFVSSSFSIKLQNRINLQRLTHLHKTAGAIMVAQETRRTSNSHTKAAEL